MKPGIKLETTEDGDLEVRAPAKPPPSSPWRDELLPMLDTADPYDIIMWIYDHIPWNPPLPGSTPGPMTAEDLEIMSRAIEVYGEKQDGTS